MADEWSGPAKGPDGQFSTELLGSNYGPKRVGVADDELHIDTDLSSATAPRDVVLRLLAAEASDRLGWVWEVERFPGHVRVKKVGRYYVNWADDPPEGTVDLSGTPDELLAAMHGRFLLSDALREAGQ